MDNGDDENNSGADNGLHNLPEDGSDSFDCKHSNDDESIVCNLDKLCFLSHQCLIHALM